MRLSISKSLIALPLIVLTLRGVALCQSAHALVPSDLVGVWGEKRILGPEVHGLLTLQCDATEGRAEIGSRSAQVERVGNDVSFVLPNGEGQFRGHLSDGQIVGHWIQPRTLAYGTIYATPVLLTPVSPNLWQGEVAPLEDAMTFYLVLGLNADSSLSAYFRNPQRNAARFMTVSSVHLDGNKVEFMSRDSKDGPEAVMATGVYDAEGERLSVFLPEAGGTYDFSRTSAVQLGGFYPRGESPAPYSYRSPLPLADGWPVATLEQVGIDADSIGRFMQMMIDLPITSVHSLELHGILIARHGKLVLEEYFHGFHRDELHDTRSAAKTITSTLAGAAIAHGYPLKTSTPVYATMLGDQVGQALDPRKRALTVEHLLTMSSGLDCDDSNSDSPGNEDTMQEQRKQPDWVQYTLDLNMIREPGEKSVYCSCNPNLVGGVIAKATGEWIPDLFQKLIAEPMQYGHYALNLMPNFEAYMGGGARFLPRDFMKLGQMMMDGGRWNGHQIVSAEWTKRAASPLVKVEDHDYGYFWWIVDYPYAGDSVRALFAGGNGGQIVMAIPELDLVIAFYAGNYSDIVFLTLQKDYVPKYILPAVKRN